MFSSKSSKARKAGDIACIFVHAGAGFHSKENESHHLQACNDACKAGMAVLRQGGSAVDAVEIAIKVLEDREITNAGYGSNLGFDGIVECDAIVVDSFGRSGAAGAVAQIKNPISLARLILDHSSQTMTLKRVPPNLLVGQGAANFGYDHDMMVVPYDSMISNFARHRWQKWRADLAKAERYSRRDLDQHSNHEEVVNPGVQDFFREQEEHEATRRAHTRAMYAAVQNDAQPVSPRPLQSPTPLGEDDEPFFSSQSRRTPTLSTRDQAEKTQATTSNYHPNEFIDPCTPPNSLQNMAHHPFANSTQQVPAARPSSRPSPRGNNDGGLQLSDYLMNDCSDLEQQSLACLRPDPALRQVPVFHDGSSGSESDVTPNPAYNTSIGDSEIAWSSGIGHDPRPVSLDEGPGTGSHDSGPQPPHSMHVPASSISESVDKITDTVGCVAIDVYGNIACGASSGGIGMKHRGRVGPAALVGIGAHVIPVDDDDEERTTVATVTSGTGEHMSTTLAASVCSQRVMHGVKKVKGGGYKPCEEGEALRSFVERDFMGHPSVKNSDSAGAIGMLSVKKNKEYAELFFGHNTDSFALASMHSDEKSPVCCMSRSSGSGSIAQGGRMIRYRKKK